MTLRVQLIGICFECSQPLSGIRCKIPIKFFIFILIFAKLNVSLLLFLISLFLNHLIFVSGWKLMITH